MQVRPKVVNGRRVKARTNQADQVEHREERLNVPARARTVHDYLKRNLHRKSAERILTACLSYTDQRILGNLRFIEDEQDHDDGAESKWHEHLPCRPRILHSTPCKAENDQRRAEHRKCVPSAPAVMSDARALEVRGYIHPIDQSELLAHRARRHLQLERCHDKHCDYCANWDVSICEIGKCCQLMLVHNRGYAQKNHLHFPLSASAPLTKGDAAAAKQYAL